MGTTNLDELAVSGAITAATVAAAFTGGLTGNVVGDLQGNVLAPVALAAGDGAIAIKSGAVIITKGSAAALTLADPTAGTDDGKQLNIYSTTAFAHTVTIAGGLNGAGAGADVGTFTAAAGNWLRLVAYNGKWYGLGLLNVSFA